MDSQIALIQAALGEHTKDMAYVGAVGSPTEFMCPTCGVAHENSFHQRLNLEAEADDLRQVYAVLVKERLRLDKRFERTQRELEELRKLSNDVIETMDRQRGEVKLRDVVDQAGISKAYEALEQEASSLAERQGQLALTIGSLQIELKNLDDPQKAKEVADTFNRYYGTFAAALDVPSPNVIRRSAIQRKPSLGGSGGPRAILAYHYALAHTARTFTNNVLPPMVLDSPHAKAQDQINRPKVTEFIFQKRTPGVQLIAAFEESLPKSIALGSGDQLIVLEKSFNMLTKDQYEVVRTRLQPALVEAKRFIASQRFLPLFPEGKN